MGRRPHPEITSPDELPKFATRLGPLVAYSWAEVDGTVEHDLAHLLVWHWCDHNVWHADPRSNPEYIPAPQWSAGGVGAHDFMSADPLHIEPSVYWPGCCGLHGFIRDGAWTEA